ncbi:MAG: hypothetical protein M3373_05785 [Gemmatimonadota bacterium]|nr:hypothetical protein [Gemmatimonadota bacterium]
MFGRILLTIALLSTLFGPIGADWNDTHVFNPSWPPHAKFHNVVGLFLTIGFSLIGLWLLWRKSTDYLPQLVVATAVPLLAWGTFFLAVLVPGAAVEDRPGTLPRVVGLPLNLFVALLFSALAIAGYAICRRAHSRQTRR